MLRLENKKSVELKTWYFNQAFCFKKSAFSWQILKFQIET